MAKRERQETPDWQQEIPYILAKNEKDFKIKYKSSCLCGAVEYCVNADPKGSKFCHCTGCQRLHGAWILSVWYMKILTFIGIP